VYYDLDNRLKADHEKAIKEQEAVDNVLNNIKTSAFGGPLQIIRFVLMFSPLLWMCLPVFTSDDGADITLISVIMGIINGSFDFGNPSYLFPFITMVCIIIFSLMVIISSLFSVGEKALSRNEIFSLINTVVFIVVSIVSCKVGGAHLSTGWFLVSITYILELEMHTLVNKKLNK
jgi:hypothetical protein